MSKESLSEKMRKKSQDVMYEECRVRILFKLIPMSDEKDL